MKMFILGFLFCLATSGLIIPDYNFPVMLKYATKSTSGLSLEIRFMLPYRDQSKTSLLVGGIAYSQYIGVTFPSGLYSFTTAGSCSLASSTTTYSVAGVVSESSTVSSATADSNTFYCKLTDKTITTLPAMTTLTLTLTLPSAISTTFVNSIGIFTSTSASTDGVIIDYNHSIGSIGQYIDYTASVNNQIAQISAPGAVLSTVTQPSSANTNLTNLYPYFTFDCTINVQIMNYWVPSSSDFTYVLRFNSQSFTAPNTVKSTAIPGSTAANQQALTGTLTLTTIDAGSVIINGIQTGDVYPNRKFQLVFSGFKSTDQNLNNQTIIELLIYYKSTYSIVSYSYINMDRVNTIAITATAFHPEYYNIFDGMGWPIQFDFSVPYDMPNGGYVVIRHRNYDKANNSFVFVSSSCDFSLIQSVDNNFGKRWNCYPLRNNFAYSDNSTGNKENHGIFFKMNSLSSSISTYSLRVWGFAERCYTSSSTTYYSTTYAFTINIYNTMQNSNLEEKRFVGSTNNYVIASNTNVTGPTCYPLQIPFGNQSATTANAQLLTFAGFIADAGNTNATTAFKTACTAGATQGLDVAYIYNTGFTVNDASVATDPAPLYQVLVAVQTFYGLGTAPNAFSVSSLTDSTTGQIAACTTAGGASGANFDAATRAATLAALTTFNTSYPLVKTNVDNLITYLDSTLKSSIAAYNYITGACANIVTNTTNLYNIINTFNGAATLANYLAINAKAATASKETKLIYDYYSLFTSAQSYITTTLATINTNIGNVKTSTASILAETNIAGGTAICGTLKTTLTNMNTVNPKLDNLNTYVGTANTKFTGTVVSAWGAQRPFVEKLSYYSSLLLTLTDPYSYDSLPYNYVYNNFSNSPVAGTAAAASTYSVGREFTNIFVQKPPTTIANLSTFGNLASANTPYKLYSDNPTNLTTGTTFTTEDYFYSSTSTLPGQNLLVFAAIRLNSDSTGAVKANDYIPGQCLSAIDDNNYITINDGRIKWFFTNTLFSQGTKFATGCQVSWQFNYIQAEANTVLDLNSTIFDTRSLYLNATSGNNNTATAYKTTINSVVIKNNPVNLDTSNSNIYTTGSAVTTTGYQHRIVSSSFKHNSIYTATAGTNSYAPTNPPSLVLNGTNNCGDGTRPHASATALYENVIQFGLYTDCLVWSAQPSTVKSLFSYFEMQGQLTEANQPLRVLRFIKLYPEAGVLQQATALNPSGSTNYYNTTNNTAWIIGHYNVTTQAASPYAVCIIEINSNDLNSSRNNSNTLLIWLFATSLLDVDYTNSTSEYPIAPLSNAKAYGLNAGHTISASNRITGDDAGVITTGTVTTSLSHPVRTYNDSRFFSSFERRIYENTVGFYLRNSNDTTTVSTGVSTPLHFRRTHYTMFLSSMIIVSSVSSNLQGSNTSNIYIPILCPTYSDVITTSTVSQTGVYFVTPIVTAAWATMSAYNNISKIDTYIKPVTEDLTIPYYRYANSAAANTYAGLTKMQYHPTNAAQVFPPYHYPLFKYSYYAFGVGDFLKANTPYFMNNSGNAGTTQLVTDKSTVLQLLKVNFNDFSKTAANDQKYIKMDSSSIAATRTLYSTALGVYLSPSIPSFDSTIQTNLPQGSVVMSTYSSSANFYINGKPFNKFAAYSKNKGDTNLTFPSVAAVRDVIGTGTSATFISYATSIVNNTAMNIQGVKQLPLSVYDSTSNVIDITDHVGVFFNTCFGNDSAIDATYTNIMLLTNFYVDTTNTSNALNGFIIYHPTVNTDNWQNSVLGTDIQTESYKNDKGSNLKITGTLPSSIPVGAQLSIAITASSIIPSTICGLIESGATGFVTDCTIQANNVNCNLTKQSASFSVCCYNVNIGTTAIQVTTSTVNFTAPTKLSQVTALSYTSAYYQTTTGFADFNIQNVIDITAGTFYAKIQSIVFSYSNTIGGFGMAQINVLLPRNPTRGSEINLIGDFSSFVITNVQTRIVATFGTNLIFGANINDGDILIQDVYSNYDSNGIKLKLKNLLYKCGVSFSRTLTFFLWPVQTTNIVNLQVSVAMKAADSTPLANQLQHTVTSIPTLTTSPVVALIQADFCKITAVTPAVPQEYGVYNVQIDLKQYTSNLQSNKPNEVFIYFPYKVFGENQVADLVCIYGGSQQYCSFIEKSLLAITFTSNIPTTGETPLNITIAGITNPNLAANNQSYLACTLNQTDFATGSRQHLIRGYHTYATGIAYNQSATIGNIRILNDLTFHSVSTQNGTLANNSSVTTTTTTPSNTVTPLNPRDSPSLTNSANTQLHQFAFTFDTANDLLATQNGLTISGTTSLIISFPPEYKLHWYTPLTITATIQAYTLNSTDLKTVQTYTSITVGTVTVIGNQVTVNFKESQLTVDKYHQYFLLQLFNIPPPVDNTANTNTGQQTTRPFGFVFSNATNSVVFRSWTNLNTFAESEILPTKPNILLSFNKGFPYTFDQTKWVVDVNDNVRQVINNVIVRTGRYTSYSFKFRSTAGNLQAVAFDVTLADNNFKLLQPTYLLNSSINENIPFFIGIACSAVPGVSVFRLGIQQSALFPTTNIYYYVMPFSPVLATITNATKGSIMFSNLYTIRINGSTFVTFTLDSYSFDPIQIQWNASTDSTIDNSTIPVGSLSTTTVMRITNPLASAPQVYTVGTPNSNCYAYQYKQIQFDINGVAAIIPNNALQANLFVYANSLIDNTITETNSVKFTLNTQYTQFYLYAVFTCIDLPLPSDADMRNQNVNVTSSTAFYSNIFNVSGNNVSFSFSNLIRGQPYQLKVFIESTQGNFTLRTTSQIVLQNYTLANGTVLQLMPTPPPSTMCASYRFNTQPGVQVKQPLLTFWQNKFTSSGYNSTGCIIVIDQYGNQAPGLPSFTNQTSCGQTACIFRPIQQQIVNQTALGIAETYIVCPKPNPICRTDPPNYSAKFNEVYNLLPTNATFNTVLNIQVVPSFVLTQLTDSNTVVTPSVSQITSTGSTVSFSAVSTVNNDCAFILTSGATPTQSQFNSCNKSECTYLSLSTTATTGQITLASTSSGSYTLFVQCQSAIPCSQTQSSVSNVGTVSLSSAVSNSTNTTTNTTNTTTPTSTSFLSMNMMLCLMIMLVFLMN